MYKRLRKNILGFLLAVLMILSPFSESVAYRFGTDGSVAAGGYAVNANASVFNDYYYFVKNDEVHITKYVGSNDIVTVPDTIEGYPVTSIWERAFWKTETPIKSVVLPYTLKSIGDYAFHELGSLTQIVIPESVESIGENAFSYTGLKSVSLSNGLVSIGALAFNNCTQLTSITIPGSVTAIGRGAFLNCRNLLSVTMNNGLLTIGTVAFMDCVKLETVNTPDSLEIISDRAFLNCEQLRSIIIGNNVTTIGTSAFQKCLRLIDITFSENVMKIGRYAFEEAAWYTKKKDGPVYAGKNFYKYKGEMPPNTSIVLEPDTKSIADGAFENCSGLKKVTIQSGLEHIGDSAFEGCVGLYNPSFPDSLVSIGNRAFRDCSSITKFHVPSGLVTIENNVFWGCSALQAITVDDNNLVFRAVSGVLYDKATTTLIYYPEGKYDACSIPFGVRKIEGRAFYNSKVTSINIPSSVSDIGEEAFLRCESLAEIIISGGVKSIGDRAFFETAWYDIQGEGIICLGSIVYMFKGTMPADTAIVIPEGTTAIAPRAFFNCTGLISVSFPNSLEFIGDAAFYSCTGLTDLILPSNVKTIGSLAFSSCDKLMNIEFPDNLTRIEDSVFSHCDSLKTVSIPRGVTQISEDAFNNSLALEAIVVHVENPSYSSYDGVLFTKDKTTLIRCPQGKTGSFTIPNETKSIQQFAFYYCPYLTTIIIGRGVEKIGHSAFKSCTGLRTVVCPDILVSFGSDVFGSNENITIYGKLQSVAHIRAGEWEIPFVSITIPTIEPVPDSGCVVDTDKHIIYGLKSGITKKQLENDFLKNASGYTLEYSRDILGTGTRIDVIMDINSGGKTAVIASYVLLIHGDVNGDGSIDANDAGIMQECENWLVDWDPVTEAAFLMAADINGDGVIGAIDADILVDVENWLMEIDQTTGLAVRV